MASGTLASLLRVIKNYHFWLVVMMFAVIIIIHYPQQILATDSPSLFSFLGLTRHAVERVFLLLPISYAGFFLGTKAGLTSLVVALAIMLPRDFLISLYTTDTLFETGSIIVIGGLLNIWFQIRRKDIAQLRKAEEALQLAYAEIEQIFKTTAVGIRVIDTDSNILQCNEAFAYLSKLPRSEILGKKCYEVFPHGLCHTDRCILKRILSGEERVETEIVVESTNGNQIHLILTATPYRQPDGKLLGMIESCNDVTLLKRAEENLHHYLQEITRAQEEERKRISRELHDSTTQNLIALLRQLENFLNEKVQLPATEAKTLWAFHSQIKDMLQELRRFSRDLRPPVLDDLGLVPALEWVTAEFKTEYGLEVGLEVTGSKRRLSRESELLLFRVVQEALRNVIKHAQASKVDVKVNLAENEVIISVSDNGKGFQPPDKLADLPQMGKLGLAGMQERIQLLGGSLNIKSELGKGTTILFIAPI